MSVCNDAIPDVRFANSHNFACLRARRFTGTGFGGGAGEYEEWLRWVGPNRARYLRSGLCAHNIKSVEFPDVVIYGRGSFLALPSNSSQLTQEC